MIGFSRGENETGGSCTHRHSDTCGPPEAALQPKFVPCGHLAESLQDTWEMVDVNSLACIFL